VDLAIAVFYTQIDFYLFFLDKAGTEIEAVRSEVAYNGNEFGLTWVSETPEKRRIQRVREYLGLEESKVLQAVPSIDAPVFDEKLRDAYDYIFESSDNS